MASRARTVDNDGSAALRELLGELDARAGNASKRLRAGHAQRELARQQLALTRRRLLVGQAHRLDEVAQIIDGGGHASLIGIRPQQQRCRMGNRPPRRASSTSCATCTRLSTDESHERGIASPQACPHLRAPSPTPPPGFESDRHPSSIMRASQQIHGMWKVERFGAVAFPSRPAEREAEQEAAGDAEQRPRRPAPHGFGEEVTEASERECPRPQVSSMADDGGGAELLSILTMQPDVYSAESNAPAPNEAP
jgi:hypothetical protein